MSQSAPSPSPQVRRLSRLDRCHDRDDPDGILVVLEILETPAHAFDLTTGISVADVHAEYPEDDRVVIAAYDRVLDRYRDAWDIESPHIVEWLRDADADLHYYPESKLERYDAGNYSEVADGCRCEHCNELVPSTTDWVEHVVRYCSGV